MANRLFEIAEQLINSGAIDVLVVDSVAALTPKAEIEGEMGDKNVGLHARPHEPGYEKTHRSYFSHTHLLHLHQPDS